MNNNTSCHPVPQSLAHAAELGKPAVLPTALAWASQGVPVVFTPGDAKAPRLLMQPEAPRERQYKATTDPASIQAAYDAYVAEHATDTNELTRIPNLAISGGDRCIILDADTPEAVESLRQWFTAATGEELPPRSEATPGMIDADGEWRHRDGGHWVFIAPKGAIPEGTTTATIGREDDAASIILGNGYALTTPSARPEGPYVWDSADGAYDAPPALVEAVLSIARQKTAAGSTTTAEPLPEDSAEFGWVEAHPWETRLASDGWVEAANDACGCSTWTAPPVEAHASTKSATAHSLECSVEGLAGKLHVWTDHPPAGLADYISEHGPTLSRLEYEAVTEFDGRLDWARVRLGVPHPDHESTIAAMQAGAEALGVTPRELGPIYATPQAEFESTGQITELSARPALSVVPDLDETPPAQAEPPAIDTDLTRMVSMLETELGRTLAAEEREELNYYIQEGERFFDAELYPEGYPVDPRLVRKIFSFSPVTQTIYHAASNALVSPLVVLACELVRVGMRLPADVEGPTGGCVSSFFSAIGPSGSGKTSGFDPQNSPWPSTSYPGFFDLLAGPAPADNDADDADDGGSAEGGVATGITQATAGGFVDFDKRRGFGSGEATITRGYFRWDDEAKEQVKNAHPALWAHSDEGGSDMNKAKSMTSTIITVQNALWAGAPISNSTQEKGDVDLAPPYSFFRTMGLQPALAASFIAHAGSGFTQRWCHLPAMWPWDGVDLGVPQPQQPAPAPHLRVATGTRFSSCASIDRARREARRRTNVVHPVDETGKEISSMLSHATWTRIKIATLAAALHSTAEVGEDLWEWSGWVMEISRKTLAWLLAEVAAEDAASASARGKTRAHERAGERAETDALVDATAQLIEKHLRKAGGAGLTMGRLKNQLAEGKKPHASAAITHLVEEGAAVRANNRVYHADAMRSASTPG
ncbi:bifunctional DNA primase/polymerase [Corynebacterium sp. P3-F1]|uniref:bifunctional DNA primase/polymerase n=1 Tax=Corynebacterium sp. P3-F1 TaxID=3059080 RepID=UPI00265CA550|nr:bifunctional DNA primase/polymerase [Corynebacterium sp. P3-F1]WKK61208.1 bifunctional DNA primase/polymerase [Corynebacterium sp. P3-F1]